MIYFNFLKFIEHIQQAYSTFFTFVFIEILKYYTCFYKIILIIKYNSTLKFNCCLNYPLSFARI